MGYTAAPLEKLIEQFSQFPGIGRKGATRMAYQVLSMSDADAAALAEAIQNAHTRLHRSRDLHILRCCHLDIPVRTFGQAYLVIGHRLDHHRIIRHSLLVLFPTHHLVQNRVHRY